MLTGNIRYSAGIEGILFQKEEISINKPNIEKTTIEILDSEDGKRVFLDFQITGVDSLEEIKPTTNDLTENIFNKLAIKENIKIGPTRMDSANLFEEVVIPEESQIIGVPGIESKFVGRKPTVEQTLLGKNLDLLIQNLGKENSPDQNQDYPTFRLALQSPDPLSVFMKLYNLLLKKKGPSQKEVDAFIKKIEPEVPESDSPRENRRETIYTRLRNEIGHHRENATLPNTEREIKQRLGHFQTLVRKAIL